MTNMLNTAVLKNTGYIIAFVTAANYLGISSESIAILGIVILLDVFTGVLKSALVDGPRTLTSSRFVAGVLAKLLLILIPISVALGGKGVGMDFTPLARGALTVLTLSQVYSIIGNIHAMQTGHDKNEFDAVATILRIFRNILEQSINGLKPPKK